MNNSEELNQLTSQILTNSPPETSILVKALIAVEKENKASYNYTQLLGTWRLVFVTGTQKVRQKAGIVLGSGKYVPKLVKIELQYSPEWLVNPSPEVAGGSVENTVNLGILQLSLTGPVKFLQPKNLLAFDFTRIKIQLVKLPVYTGYLPEGKKKEAEFYNQKIAKQAFFRYFWVGEQGIAARGRGGGLAIWVKSNPPSI